MNTTMPKNDADFTKSICSSHTPRSIYVVMESGVRKATPPGRRSPHTKQRKCASVFERRGFDHVWTWTDDGCVRCGGVRRDCCCGCGGHLAEHYGRHRLSSPAFNERSPRPPGRGLFHEVDTRFHEVITQRRGGRLAIRALLVHGCSRRRAGGGGVAVDRQLPRAAAARRL